MCRRLLGVVLIFCVLARWGFAAEVGVPQLLNYQGMLTDARGVPIEGPVAVGFGFYDALVKGHLLYYEEQAVTAQKGIFHVLIGNGSAQQGSFASIYAVEIVYLQIVVDPQGAQPSVLTPRQRIASAVFALKAGTVPGLADALARLQALEDRMATVNTILAEHDEILEPFSRVGNTVTLTGVNLQIVNGVGSTMSKNGVGNLIVGYNESRGAGDDRSGSHSIILGREQNYSSYAGLLGGRQNTVSAPFASVVAGLGNTASGDLACVAGGWQNTASGIDSVVSGGHSNAATATCASVSGGASNEAGEQYSSVSGGYMNETTGMYSSVSGGTNNIASGLESSISGGRVNWATGTAASCSGGYNNRATGTYSSCAGGKYNTASGWHAFVAGGGGSTLEDGNEAFADYSAVLGGAGNIAGDPDLADHTIGEQATVSGGHRNIASGWRSSITAGEDNEADWYCASVTGGMYNRATGAHASVTGGESNTASYYRASVTGGINNVARGMYSSVTGGDGNDVAGISTSISGGHDRSIGAGGTTDYDWRAGALFQDF